MNKSIETIKSPEFINLEPIDINPLMSKCQIKVLYVGENRNQTFISKDQAIEMSKTLRGAPIVGYFKESKEDFDGHGNEVVINEDGISFNCLTVPYGFVAPNAEVWFQEFEDTNDFGEVIKREYLMTTGFLWTGQYSEAQLAVEGEGRPQSMELVNVDGHWSANSQGIDFYIITDATFSKLCILGEDVEPCFEGASISAAPVQTFTKVDNDFKRTLYSMMQELKAVLSMDNIQEPDAPENNNSLETVAVLNVPENNEINNLQAQYISSEAIAAIPAPENNELAELQEQYSKSLETIAALNAQIEGLSQEINEAKEKFSVLNKETEELRAFKTQIINQQKDAMIAEFSSLSDEEKAEVIANKDKYSVEQIEEKLSVIYCRKKAKLESMNTANFQINTESRKQAITYDVPDSSACPAWIQAIKNIKTYNYN